MGSLPSDRRLHLQSLMREKEIDACLFFHYSDISYLTSSHLGNFLFLPKEGTAILFTRKAYQRVKDYNSDITVVAYHSYKDIQNLFPFPLSKKTLGVPFARVDYATLTRFMQAFSLSSSQFMDAESLLEQLTLIKDSREILGIRQANENIAQIFSFLTADMVLKQTEAQIAAYLYGELRKAGFIGDYFFRRPIPFTGVEVLTRESILSFSNADTTYAGEGICPTLATGSGRNEILENIPFIIDIMQNIVGSHADVTRTFVVGTPSDRLIARYEDLLKIQNSLLSNCQVGTPISKIYGEGLKMAHSLGYEKNFMGLYPEQVPFVGHSLGAWVDEYPPFAQKINIPLQKDMTFSLEPKLFFPDFDAPGIESNYLQTDDGAQSLTPLSNALIIL